MEIKIISLDLTDLDEAVKLHMEAFEGFFLTLMGSSFLKELYLFIKEDPNGIGLVAKDIKNKKMVAVLIGTLSPSEFYKNFIKKKWKKLLIISTKAILKRPKIIMRLARGALYRGDQPRDSNYALLSSIAVSPHYHNQGVGKKILFTWLNTVQLKGIEGCYLTTDYNDNDVANKFYTSLGWKLDETYFTKEGRKMNRYRYDIIKSPLKD